MSEANSLDDEPLMASLALPPRRAWVVSSWVVIVVLVLINVYLHMFPPAQVVDESRDNRIDYVLTQFEARYLVGVHHLFKHSGQGQASQAARLNVGSPGQRLRAVVVAGELSGPREASAQLRSLESLLEAHPNAQLRPDEKRVAKILGLLYRDYTNEKWTAPSVGTQDRTFLRDDLGWLGALALAPEKSPDQAARAEVVNSARKTVIVFLLGLGGLFLLTLAGLVALVLVVILLASRSLRGGLAGPSGHGGIYAETFAVWMAVFMVLNIGASLLPVAAHARLFVIGVAILLSLLALGWPVLRGIPWKEVRGDIGLTAGPQLALEPFNGVVTYIMALPLLTVGLVIMLVLIALHGFADQALGRAPDDPLAPNRLPAHPIIDFLSRPTWWGVLQVFFVASFVAPVVEETMFRGVLYRHLRDASYRWGVVPSFLVSGFVVNFIFAVIHPQGILAVPVLMGLAFALTLAREWRSTLLPSMIAHGISNGILLSLFLLAFGS